MIDVTNMTIGQFIREAVESRLAEVHVSLPCKVVSYDSANNVVNLQPLLRRKRRSKDGTVTASAIPALQNVPVAFQRVNGAWITLPIAAGDIGMVTFSERSIGDWMGTPKGELVTPSDETLHPLAGAWFYPGGYPSKNPISPINTSHPVFHTETELHLGEQGLSADQFVAIAKLVKDEISALRNTVNGNVTIFNAHTHPSGMGPTGTPVASESAPAAVGDVKATKVKAK